MERRSQRPGYAVPGDIWIGADVVERRTRPFTYADYCALDDDTRHEVVDGELLVSPSPDERHQRFTGRLFTRLSVHVEEHGAGRVYVAPFDVILSETNVVQPDVLFVAQAQVAEVIQERGVFGAPDLVVEVLSPSTEARDRQGKLVAYQRAGVAEHWLVAGGDAPSIEVRRRKRGRLVLVETLGPGDVLTTPLLPGLRLDLAKLFAP